jgi:hypothetical protein
MLDFLKSLHLKALITDIAYSLKSALLSSPKRVAITASAAVLIVSLISIDLFFGPESGGSSPTVKLKTPALTDTSGDKWSLELLKGQSGRVLEDEGKRPGPPLLLKPTGNMRGSTIEVGLTMEGQVGEKYVPGAIKNGQWVDPPKFELVSEKGKILASGQFEYG